MTKTKYKQFRQTLKKTVVTMCMGLAFAAFKPAAEAAPKSSENTAKVGNMAEPKMKVAGMKEFDDFSGKVSGWAVTNLTKDEKTSYFQRLADNKASVKKSVREYNLGRLVQKILRNEPYKAEADSLKISITPALEKEIRSKFSGMQRDLQAYLVGLRLAQIKSGTLTLEKGETLVSGGSSQMRLDSLRLPGTELVKIYTNTFRGSFLTEVPIPSRDMIANFGDSDIAQQFANKSAEGLQYGISHNWDKSSLINDSGANKLAKDLAKILDKVVRPDLKENAQFQNLREKLRTGDLSALNELLKSKTDLGNALVKFLDNIVTIDVKPEAINVYTAKGSVVWKYSKGVASFNKFLDSARNKTYLKPAFLGLFVDAAFAMQDIVAITTQIKGADSDNPQVMMDRLTGKGMTASLAAGFIAGAGLLGAPMVLTCQVGEIGYEQVKVPLRTPLIPKPGEPAISEYTEGRAFFGIVGFDLWFPGKNDQAVIRLLSPHVGVKHYGGIDSRNFMFYASAGFEFERGRHKFRADVAPQVFILGEKVNATIRTAVSKGVTVNANYLVRQVKSIGGADLSAGVQVDYQHSGYEGENRHLVRMVVPIEWIQTTKKRRRFSIGVAPGFIAHEGDFSRKIFTIMGSGKVEF